MAIVAVGGKTLGIVIQCRRRQGKVQQMQSQSRQQTEAAHAMWTANANFLSAPSLIRTIIMTCVCNKSV